MLVLSRCEIENLQRSLSRTTKVFVVSGLLKRTIFAYLSYHAEDSTLEGRGGIEDSRAFESRRPPTAT